ncbi:MAG: Vi polysaccharide biosynthesis protein VipB/TviC [Latescibacteria bacterium DG_63]|nr:MAG: Vi polysaccharide biosynthesis protein VipB/TviC [Latescibacteria bacterium DG_63]
MCKYLVTGGAGFIGSNIAERLLKEDREVVIFDDFSTGKEENVDAAVQNAKGKGRLVVIRGDIRDAASLKEAMAGVMYVFHEAALCSVQRSVEDPATTDSVNIGGTLRLLAAAREQGVKRVVYASSSSVYGNGASLPNREEMRPDPCSPYALTKFAAEEYCRLFSSVYGLETVSLRYFNVFGPRQDSESQYAAVIPIFIARVLSGARPVVFGDGEQSRDFTFVDDLVDANLLACDKEGIAGRTYNIARGNRRTLNELVQTLRTVTGNPIEPEYAPPRPAEVRHSEASIEKAEKELGFRAKVSFEEGLERTLGWFRDRGQQS